jgi:predicted sulfurtransferase
MNACPTRRWPALLAALAIALLPALAGPAAAADDAPRLAADEVKRLAEKGDVVILDVRGKDAYDMEHAEGAVSIPLQELEARMSELPKNKLIAAYCT